MARVEITVRARRDLDEMVTELTLPDDTRVRVRGRLRTLLAAP